MVNSSFSAVSEGSGSDGLEDSLNEYIANSDLIEEHQDDESIRLAKDYLRQVVSVALVSNPARIEKPEILWDHAFRSPNELLSILKKHNEQPWYQEFLDNPYCGG